MNTKFLVITSVALVILSTQAKASSEDMVEHKPIAHLVANDTSDNEPPVDEDDELDLLGQCPVWPACGITTKGD